LQASQVFLVFFVGFLFPAFRRGIWPNYIRPGGQAGRARREGNRL
jgi:hypothetical protein